MKATGTKHTDEMKIFLIECWYNFYFQCGTHLTVRRYLIGEHSTEIQN